MSQQKKASKLIFVLLVVAFLWTPVLAVAVPNYYPKDYDKIIEASRAEKGLYIYSNVSTDNWKPLLALFNKLYPWINVKLLDLGGSEVLPRYIAESQTGTPTADFLVTQSAPGWARLLGENRLLRYPSPEIPHLPAWSSRQETVYSFSADPAIMAWNTKIFPADMVPKGMADFAEKVQKKPEFFRGRLTSYNEGAFGGYSAFGFYKHHGEKFWNWLDIIGPMTRPGSSGGDQLEKMLSGEYMMSWNFSAINLASSTAKRAGNLIGWKYTEDGNPVLVRGMGITIKAANPNSAKLLLDLLLSQEGQVALTKGNMTVYRPDAADKIPEPTLHLAGLIKAIGEKNMIVVGWDPEYGDEAKFKALQARWRQAVFGKK